VGDSATCRWAKRNQTNQAKSLPRVFSTTAIKSCGVGSSASLLSTNNKLHIKPSHAAVLLQRCVAVGVSSGEFQQVCPLICGRNGTKLGPYTFRSTLIPYLVDRTYIYLHLVLTSNHANQSKFGIPLMVKIYKIGFREMVLAIHLFEHPRPWRPCRLTLFRFRHLIGPDPLPTLWHS
jgi:hypothetical protein